MPRTSTIRRKTTETDIRLRLALDGRGKSSVTTGIRFFDHMRAQRGYVTISQKPFVLSKYLSSPVLKFSTMLIFIRNIWYGGR